MKKIISNLKLALNTVKTTISSFVKSMILMIEEIISLDKNGRSYFNSSINYRNSTRSYKNDYMPFFKIDFKLLS